MGSGSSDRSADLITLIEPSGVIHWVLSCYDPDINVFAQPGMWAVMSGWASAQLTAIRRQSTCHM